MTDPPYWFDIGTASAWLVLSLLGIALRLRRLVHLRRIVLVTPSVRADVEYLALVKRSTVLRLIVKAVFLVGALIALFGLTWLWPFWRVGIVVALLCMLTETASVDRVRSRLGRTVGPDWMLPDTISSLELIRFFVALYGIRVAWTGRRLALASLRTIAPEQPSDLHERSSQALRSERMRLFEVIQTGILCVHLLLLANVVINMAYPSGSVEQPNVMSSNVAQILIPFILIRLSELIVAEMGVAGRMRSVTGPRTPPVAAKEEP